MKCRYCNSKLELVMCDLGTAPYSNSYLTKEKLDGPEIYVPLKVVVCEDCWLVQTSDQTQRSRLFNDQYAYFSSTSLTWQGHTKRFSDKMVEMLKLNNESFVVEVASNDGCLLQNFDRQGIRCLGVEPTASTAHVARSRGIETEMIFFDSAAGERIREHYGAADLIVANNVLAHVPDIKNFMQGFKNLLNADGLVSFEFPSLLNLVSKVQFDTIYHEHYSYLSGTFVSKAMQDIGLKCISMEKLDTHGGSLRMLFAHEESKYLVNDTVEVLLEEELVAAMFSRKTYENFQERVNQKKNKLLEKLLRIKNNNQTVYGFGAAAKGNTFLNFAGIKEDLLPMVFDSAKSKQGLYLPGSRIPVVNPSALTELRVDYLLVLPWNIKSEIQQLCNNLGQKDASIITLEDY